MASSSAFFQTFKVGSLELPNRAVMAPLTRGRAESDGTHNVPLAIKYYTQRASAGLIVSEATAISRQGSGWLGAPGIYTDSHVAAWKSIVSAVHAAGGRIYLQLWHMGRVSHPSFQIDNQLPVAPSPIAASGHSHTASGNQPYVVPRALETDELASVVADYVHAARNARAAGFDGVELHAANGYLLDQFLRDGTNQRTDRYGGSIENRARLLLEVVDGIIAAAWDADHVAVRISPTGAYNDMRDSDPVPLYTYVAAQLAQRNIAYLHVVEGLPGSWTFTDGAPTVAPHLRAQFRGPLILNGGYDLNTGAQAIQTGSTDLVAFGVPWIANPDLVHRIRSGAAWAAPDFSTFYTPGEAGYTDYPALDEAVAVAVA